MLSVALLMDICVKMTCSDKTGFGSACVVDDYSLKRSQIMSNGVGDLLPWVWEGEAGQRGSRKKFDALDRLETPPHAIALNDMALGKSERVLCRQS